MIARTRGKPIHYLRNIERWIWLLIGGGALVFFAIVSALALLHPTTPANQLVTWWNGGLFLIPAAMMGTGFYMSLRWWRCPQCGRPLPTKGSIPEQCPRCGNVLREM